MNTYKTDDGTEVIAFSTTEDMNKNINSIVFIKVVDEWFYDEYESYIFTLENGEKIQVDMWEYNKIQVHESDEGIIYKPVIIEHEDSERAIEYIGFQIEE